ncbi:GspE/PulE family protein [Methylophaga thiooxydans]|uniref:GspE/PulE family protein n=1 Tax=Methylophaga thiooxydans TaxID=392484 RepID=UPI002355EA7C|nr:GspE/PulE family protein [Methylophaga thiooxydans]
MAVRDEQLITASIETGLVEQSVVDQLRLSARRERVPLLSKILAHYRLPLSALHRALAEQHGFRFVDMSSSQLNTALTKKLPSSLINRKQMIVVNVSDESVLVISDPTDRTSIDAALRLVGDTIPVVMTDPEHLRLTVKKVLANTAVAQASTTSSSDTDLIALLDQILRDAYLNRASDVHLMIEEEGIRVRFRVDGRLSDYPLETDPAIGAGLISRVKVLSGLDISEQRMPQDGGFSYQLAAPVNMEFNIRVATAPTRLGERITMRLLGSESNTLTLTDLGFLESDLVEFKQAIRKPYGMILLTGPTGSGKSTTLCAALQEINRPEINIMTVENPIEYVIEGISQIQTGPKINFADALRSLLRHDPDVLMVGEIRDSETADVAVKAAMTGHLVFSTLHTNNAVSAVTRLIDIGCEPFLIGSTMTAVIAQRLVRRLCRQCAKARPATEDELMMLGTDEQVEIFEPVGCPVCQGQGFRGRLGLYETLWFNEKLARMIAKGADEETLEASAGESLKFMWEDGCEKVLRGLTTLDEVRDVAVFKRHDMAEVN